MPTVYLVTHDAGYDVGTIIDGINSSPEAAADRIRKACRRSGCSHQWCHDVERMEVDK
jgi:hypothetical protein